MNEVPFVRFDHVQLAIPAGGEERARAFYVGLLGFEELPKPEPLRARGGLWLRSGDVYLHLGVDPEFAAATKAHPALRCAEYAALVARLAAHGVHVWPDPLPFEGSEHGYLDDPFGNRLEFIDG